MSKKICAVLAGVSGSGKSTFSNGLKNLVHPDSNLSAISVSADKFFYQDGEYNFDAGKLGKAHKWCREQFEDAINLEVPLVFVDNTNTVMKEAKFYLEYAEKKGYETFYLAVLPWRNQQNEHNVPQKSLQKQCQRLKDTISACLDNHISNQNVENIT